MYRSDESDTLDGINNNTYNLLFIDEISNYRLAKTNREFLMAAIQSLTKLDDENIELVLSNQNIIERNDMVYTVKRNSEEYSFAFLDLFLEEKKEELRSDKRIGKCVLKSIALANSYDDKCKVIIGYMNNSTDKLLHVVFVQCNDKKEYVFDYTMNLVMEKQQYIKLTNYKIINEVDGENIKNDLKTLFKIEHISSKFYLCFRDEFIKDLNRNSKVLKLED